MSYIETFRASTRTLMVLTARERLALFCLPTIACAGEQIKVQYLTLRSFLTALRDAKRVHAAVSRPTRCSPMTKRTDHSSIRARHPDSIAHSVLQQIQCAYPHKRHALFHLSLDFSFWERFACWRIHQEQLWKQYKPDTTISSLKFWRIKRYWGPLEDILDSPLVWATGWLMQITLKRSGCN